VAKTKRGFKTAAHAFFSRGGVDLHSANGLNHQTKAVKGLRVDLVRCFKNRTTVILHHFPDGNAGLKRSGFSIKKNGDYY
jgi:hypothetical protein